MKKGFTPLEILTNKTKPLKAINFSKYMQKKNKQIAGISKRGFTLLELLIVVGILALLTAVAVLILNPVELLARARDSKRMTDLDNIKNAINLYLATATSTDVSEGVSGDVAYVSASGARCSFNGVVNLTDPIYGGAIWCQVNTSRNIDGSGWVAVDFRKINGGSPLAVLPIDPISDTVYYYTYVGDESDNTFELNARLESKRYRDKMISDGGDRNNCVTYVENNCFYEVGNDPGLNERDDWSTGP